MARAGHVGHVGSKSETSRLLLERKPDRGSFNVRVGPIASVWTCEKDFRSSPRSGRRYGGCMSPWPMNPNAGL